MRFETLRAILIAAYFAIPAVGALHLVASPDVTMGVLFLVPVVAAAWMGGHAHGLVAAALCAVTMFVAGYYLAVPQIPPGVVVWNSTAWLASLVSVAVLASSLRRAREAMIEVANVDVLTGLPNITAFADKTELEVTRAQRYGRPLTLAYLGLDNFKRINERQGYRAGDNLLARVAVVIRSGLRSSDVIARIAGDEFAVLLPETGDDAALEVLTRLKAAMLKDLRATGCGITVSIGAATYLMPPEDVEEMIRRADTLMSAAKDAGKNNIRHVIFDGQAMGTVAMMVTTSPAAETTAAPDGADARSFEADAAKANDTAQANDTAKAKDAAKAKDTARAPFDAKERPERKPQVGWRVRGEAKARDEDAARDETEAGNSVHAQAEAKAHGESQTQAQDENGARDDATKAAHTDGSRRAGVAPEHDESID